MLNYSTKAAESISSRFVAAFKSDKIFPGPQSVLDIEITILRDAGLSGRKVEYLQSLAKEFISKELDRNSFDSMDDEQIIELLCSIKGIGPWTANMFLMFYLQRADILPVGDFGIRKGLLKFAALKSISKKKLSVVEMEELCEHWRPYRSVASFFMWKLVSE